MGFNVKSLARSSILVAVALVLSIVEKLFPLSAAVPLPGIKLGLANIITMYAIFYLGLRTAITISFARCFLASIFAGGPTSLLFSLTGSAFSIFVMYILKKGYGRFFSVFGVSIPGALAHNLGQITAASLLLQSTAVFSYLPVLTYVGIFTGAITAATAMAFFPRLSKL